MARLTVQDMGNPDVILILGGTNDSWHDTLDYGNYQYSDWVYDDLIKFRPVEEVDQYIDPDTEAFLEDEDYDGLEDE